MIEKVVLLTTVLALGACQSAPRNRPASPTQDARGDSLQIRQSASAVPDYVATKSLADVRDFAKTLPKPTSLVVFDIDDTLLSTPFISGSSGPRRFFGSDAWYNWQSPMKGEGLHAIPCLFEFLAINYEIDTQPPTEQNAGTTVKDIASDKLLLTSRSPDYRSGTERELKEAKIPQFKQLTMNPNVFIRTPEGVPMTYVNGLYMTKGANKGEALFALLEELGIERKYSDIVLVDDGWKNIQEMGASVNGRSIRFHGFLYQGIKKDWASEGKENPLPTPAEIGAADEAWKTWLDALGKSYPERKARFDNTACTK